MNQMQKLITNNLKDIINNYNKISDLQKVQQFFKQGYLSIADYHNGKHYSTVTDLTSYTALTHIRNKMLNDSQGIKILSQLPRVTNQTLLKCQDLPDNTFGKRYHKFMTKNSLLPSERPIVNFIDDLQLAYISQRYKQIHDFVHVILQDDITVQQEILIKWFEMIQLNIPSASFAVLTTPFLAKDLNLSKIARICQLSKRCPFIMNIYFENHLSQDYKQLKKRLNLL